MRGGLGEVAEKVEWKVRREVEKGLRERGGRGQR